MTLSRRRFDLRLLSPGQSRIPFFATSKGRLVVTSGRRLESWPMDR